MADNSKLFEEENKRLEEEIIKTKEEKKLRNQEAKKQHKEIISRLADELTDVIQKMLDKNASSIIAEHSSKYLKLTPARKEGVKNIFNNYAKENVRDEVEKIDKITHETPLEIFLDNYSEKFFNNWNFIFHSWNNNDKDDRFEYFIADIRQQLEKNNFKVYKNELIFETKTLYPILNELIESDNKADSECMDMERYIDSCELKIQQNKALLEYDPESLPASIEKIKVEAEEKAEAQEEIKTRLSDVEVRKLEEAKAELDKKIDSEKEDLNKSINSFIEQFNSDLRSWLDFFMSEVFKTQAEVFLNLEESKKTEAKGELLLRLSGIKYKEQELKFRENLKQELKKLIENIFPYLNKINLIVPDKLPEKKQYINFSYKKDSYLDDYRRSHTYEYSFRNVQFTKEQERLLANIEFYESRLIDLNSKLEAVKNQLLPEKAMRSWETLLN